MSDQVYKCDKCGLTTEAKVIFKTHDCNHEIAKANRTGAKNVEIGAKNPEFENIETGFEQPAVTGVKTSDTLDPENAGDKHENVLDEQIVISEGEVIAETDDQTETDNAGINIQKLTGDVPEDEQEQKKREFITGMTDKDGDEI